jgi:alpha-tubulin suppressor-like RCC1 family protein
MCAAASEITAGCHRSNALAMLGYHRFHPHLVATVKDVRPACFAAPKLVMHTIRRPVAVLPWGFTLMLVACGGNADSLTAPDRQVAFVTVSPAAATIRFGTKIQLTATVKGAAGNVLTDRTVTWSSSNTDIATVTSRGLVVGVAPGSAMITARTEGIEGAASITVSPLVFAALDAGGIHTCGLTTDGAAYCWGGSSGSPIDASTPAVVAGGLMFRSLSAGGVHTCGLATDGAAYCWGAGSSGQLGNGSTAGASAPVAVSGGLTFESLSAGGWHTCGVTRGGVAYCWGRGDLGQLGTGNTAHESTPVGVSGGPSFQSLSAGRRHTCGVSMAGAGYCWGSGGEGTPEEVGGGQTFHYLSAGENHTCGASTDGAGYCWGVGFSGQLGNGSTADTSTPEAVSGGHTFRSLSAGGDHSCGVTTDGIAYCWGFNDGGQLGNGSADRVPHPTPEAVSGGLAFQSVTTGLFHSCGLTAEGAAYCWGWNNFGQLGSNGASANLTTPVPVTGQQ